MQENKIQAECVKWFRNTYCKRTDLPRCAIFSVPNEGRNQMEQLQKIATGLLAGVSDLIIILPNKIVFVEMKDATGKQSPGQIEFEQTVTNLGFEYYLIRSVDEFKLTIDNLFNSLL